MLVHIRRIAFWTLDIIRGGAKHRYYKELCNSTYADTNTRLRELLVYAKSHVPFYREITGREISAFPVMNKDKYKMYDENMFLSDEFKDQDLHTVYTSGSTGTPFRVVQDKNKREHVICDLIHCHNSIGWHLGERYVFIRNWVSNYKQSKLKSFMQNVHIINIVNFNDDAKKRLYKWLNKHKRTIIFGYASAVYDFAKYIECSKLDGSELKIKLVVCDSDVLTDAMRKCMKNVFKCPIFNRYDNEENGLLGISEADKDGFHLNTASLLFEILKLDNDETQEPGEIGRVVVTDLFNHAMPLIRYDTGDLAISYDNPLHITEIYSLEGRRKASLLNTEGRLVSDVEISAIIEPFIGISKYQLIQENEKRFSFKYVGTLTSDEKNEIMNRLIKSLGESSEISLKQAIQLEAGKNEKYSSTINKWRR